MPKYVCPDCRIPMRVSAAGVTVVELFLSPPEPYLLWGADMLECDGCNNRVVANFADRPFARHSDADIVERIESIVKSAKHVIISQERPGALPFGAKDERDYLARWLERQGGKS